MESPKSPDSKKSAPDAFASWGLLIGGIVGVIIGVFTRHVVAWAITVAVVGFFAGALIDRSRR